MTHQPKENLMREVDERDQSGQQHGDGDNAGEDVVQGDKTVVNNPEPEPAEQPEPPVENPDSE